MSWKTIRLELARAARFPQGSAGRAYLLHLPVDEDGTIDEEVFDRTPALATVRRHWPSERDRSGYVIRRGTDWLFSFDDRKDCDETAVQLPAQTLKPGCEVNVIEPDGESHAYRVMSYAARFPAAQLPALPIADASAAQ
jgi:hypothetical protein